MADERGQATVEWIGLVLLVALGLGALLAFGPRVDGRSYGGFLARAIVCAVRGGCDDGRSALQLAYGERDAELVRRFAPNLVYEPGEREIPIDFRRCRTTKCGNAPTDRSLDVSRTDAGVPATVFTHVIHAGSSTFIQYWFYYPDSDSYFPGSHVGWKVLNVANLIWGTHRPLGRYPGFHHDDWEGSSSTLARTKLWTSGDYSFRATTFDPGFQECRNRVRLSHKPPGRRSTLRSTRSKRL